MSTPPRPPPPPPPPTRPLPPNWEQVPSGEGDFYYWNRVTSEVTWERPVAPPPPPPPRPSAQVPPPPPPPRLPPAPAGEDAEEGGLASSSSTSTSRTAGVTGGDGDRVRRQAPAPRTGAATTTPPRTPSPATSPDDSITKPQPRGVSPVPLEPLSPTDTSCGGGPPKPVKPCRQTTPSISPVPGKSPATSPPLSPTPDGTPAVLKPRATPPLPGVDAQRFIRKSYSRPERQVAAAALGLIFTGDNNFTGRELLREGPVKKISRDGPEEIQVFLFNDTFIYADMPLLATRDNKYTLRREMKLETCAVGECDPPVPNRFLVQSPQKSFVLETEDNIEKTSWINDLTAQIKVQMAAHGITTPPSAFAPVWDANKDASACAHCNAKFGILNARHHCRSCGHIYCQSCCYNKSHLPHVDEKKLVRVCVSCYRDLSEHRQYGAARGGT